MYSTGKSISVSVAVAMRACVRAKLCGRVRAVIPPGRGLRNRDLWGAAGRPAGLPAGRRRGSMEIEKI